MIWGIFIVAIRFFQDDQTPLIVGSHSLITLAQPNRAITSLLRALFPHSVADVPPQHLQQWWDLLGHSAGSSHPPFFSVRCVLGIEASWSSLGEVSRSAPWDSTDFDAMPRSQLHFDHSERRDSTPGQTLAGKAWKTRWFCGSKKWDSIRKIKVIFSDMDYPLPL